MTDGDDIVCCPMCHGSGEITDCDGQPTCSHVNDREYVCPECDGTGEVVA